MELIWYGTASLILREQGTVIAFDPFGKLAIHGFTKKPQQICHGKKATGEQVPGSEDISKKTQQICHGKKATGEQCSGSEHYPKKTHPILHEEEYRKATDVFVTHGHFDHIYHIPQIYRDGKVRIYCTDAPMKTLEMHGIPDMEIVKITPGWSGKVGPFQISAYQGRHCKFDLPMVFDILCRPSAWRYFFYSIRLATMSLSYPEKREILFYEVKVAVLRIQIMGSMNLDPDVTYPTGADVLILPLQGRSDQDEYALQFVERLKPKQVLLDHYDDAFPPISQDVDVSGFVKNVQERLHIPCRAMKEGEVLSWETM